MLETFSHSACQCRLFSVRSFSQVSQQNGKFYYVGDRSRAPVSLSPGTALKLPTTATATTSRPTSSLVPQGNSQIVIPGAGLSLDSISASPHMLKMASNLLLGGGGGGGGGGGVSSGEYTVSVLVNLRNTGIYMYAYIPTPSSNGGGDFPQEVVVEKYGKYSVCTSYFQ